MKSTARNIDKPINILGLLPEDLAIAGGTFGVGIVFNYPGWGLIAALIVALVWGQYRKGKPEGYLLHLIYHAGWPLGDLLPPPRRRRHYSF